jgi:hypothetical protein
VIDPGMIIIKNGSEKSRMMRFILKTALEYILLEGEAWHEE